MKVSTKARYAIVALVDIARQPHMEPVSLRDLSQRQSISMTYLEQLFAKLRRFGLVGSVRGSNGGFVLKLSPRDIRVSDVLLAVEEDVNALIPGAGAKGADSGTAEQDLSRKLWEGLGAHTHVFLHQTTLDDILNSRILPCPALEEF